MSVTDVTARIAQIQGQLSLLRATTPSVGADTTGTTGALGAGSTSSTQFSDALSLVLGASPDGAPTSGTSGDSSPLADQVIAEARTFVGMPYVWGGDSPSDGGMDCSGLMQYVFGRHGIDLPRVSADQARAGTAVGSMAEARPGDLVAWDNSSRNNGADHIALYLGDGKILEAPRTGLDIRVIDLAASGHGEPDYIRRVLPEAAPSGSGGGLAAVAGRVAAGRTALPPSPYDDLFATAGARHGVDPSLLSAVAKQESSYRPGAVSPAGAQGLMQLMPGTAAGLGVEDPFDPSQAVDGAARLLRDLLDRFGRVDLALAGYNAGPGAVLRYDGVPPYPETQNYVRSVLGSLGGSVGAR
ncbi:transglycosylase SLT domain-containing protein [Nocardioides sp. R-C-SC26]|uniref:transglycosylase SLT domain-containing protein n=1 Tax=Nocardioides sp. R-C-SC26 TaxID=2870414 RepID=UPI001E2FE253|nr:transglycosylase SLT domain-containing protein [Nocardioides sp. R-C-SC26]